MLKEIKVCGVTAVVDGNVRVPYYIYILSGGMWWVWVLEPLWDRF